MNLTQYKRIRTVLADKVALKLTFKDCMVVFQVKRQKGTILGREQHM